jgi:hypothetical protein
MSPIRITADYSAETLKARRTWKNAFKALKENNYQFRLLCLAKLSSIINE